MDASILPFFKPQGVVVIGVSTSPEKLGYGVARNLIQSGYQGAIHLVGQKESELLQHRVYANLDSVPEPVDLAILIVPPLAAPRTIEECGERNIEAAIIMSSGFREAGEDGARREEECLNIARAQGVRLLGPNCIGVINTHLPLDTTFLQPPMPTKGNIGFISQSGAFCAAIIDWSRKEGFGFSQIVSLGNQADVNETDALSALAEDDHTQVIAMYMESVSNGRRFVEVARKVTRQKPVIALKAGRFEAGQKAAASHTGALAASDIAFEAAFEKAGILRADSAEQMFDWARALEVFPNGLQRRVSTSHTGGIAILTNAGGPGVLAADSLEKNGLPLAQLTSSTLETLSAQLPPAANIHNPVDMLASASPDAYGSCLSALLKDDHVDGAIVILPPPPMFDAKDVAIQVIQALKRLDKPVVIALMGSSLVEEARSLFQQAHVPTFPFAERAASALSALAKRTEFLTAETKGGGELPASQGFREPVVSTSPYGLLAACGIEAAPIKLACSIDEVVAIANDLGYPVVLKIASADIVHKSDVGGVILDIKDSRSLQIAYRQMLERVREASPGARIDGVNVQRQIPTGQEVIVGAVRDPQFGPLMMFGSGGVEVEGLRDVAFALAPLSETEALKMIRRTWAGRKLRGFRNILPADEAAVLDVLVKLSHLVLEQQSIQEIELNPLRVLQHGSVAVDVRVR